MTGVDRYVALPAGRFHYREYGDSSAPTLVFLHGVFLAAVSYDVLLSELARTFHVLALDFRGHGQSVRCEDYSWPRFVDDVEAFWDALELDGATLVGHSRGANAAARFAGRCPDRVQQLILIEAGFGPETHPEAHRYWETALQLMPPDGFASLEDYVDLVVKLFPRSDRSILAADWPRFVQDENGRWHWPYLADFAVLNTNTPTSEEEHALRIPLTCPVLIVKSEYSELFVGDAFREVAKEYANGSATVHHDSGHNVMWENVPGLVALIRDAILRGPQDPSRTR